MESEGKVISLWLLQVPGWAIAPSCLGASLCRGGVKCVTPFILRGGQAVSRTENALFLFSQHKGSFIAAWPYICRGASDC